MNAGVVRPASEPPRPYRFPAHTRTRLGNGLDVLIAPVRRLPIAAIEVVVDAGAASEPDGKGGVAELAARALVEGTESMSAVELVERLERLGSAVSADADWDSATLSISAMSDRLEEIITVLAEILQTPTFPETEIERLKGERLSEIVQIRSEPRALADEWFSRKLYDVRSRYSEPIGGNAITVSSLQRTDVVEQFQRAYTPATTTVIIAGDVSEERVLATVEASLGSWRRPAPPRVHRSNRTRQSPATVLVERAGAPQSELRLGHAGPPRNTSDYFPLVVMNAILGGLFSSRINLNLRERNAYTYGARSAFDWRRDIGPFAVKTAVETGVTTQALREILNEIAAIREQSVSETELSLARDYLAGVFPIRFETSRAIAAALAQLVVYELPAGFYDEYRDRILAVAASDVLRVAREYLDPEKFLTVIVGDPNLGSGGLRDAAPETFETVSL